MEEKRYVLMPGVGQDGTFIGYIERGLCNDDGTSIGGLIGAQRFASAEEAAAYARKHNQVSIVLRVCEMSFTYDKDWAETKALWEKEMKREKELRRARRSATTEDKGDRTKQGGADV